MTDKTVLGELDLLSDIEAIIDESESSRHALIEALVRHDPCDFKALMLEGLLEEDSLLRQRFAGIYNVGPKPTQTLPAERHYFNSLETLPGRSDHLWSGYVDKGQRALVRDDVKRLCPSDEVFINADDLMSWTAPAGILPPSVTAGLGTHADQVLLPAGVKMQGLPNWFNDYHEMVFYQLPFAGKGSHSLIDFEQQSLMSAYLKPYELTDHALRSRSSFELVPTTRFDVHFGINLNVQAMHPDWVRTSYGDPYVQRPEVYQGNTWRRTLTSNAFSSSEVGIYAYFHDGIATQDFSANAHLAPSFANLYKVCEHRFTLQELNTGAVVQLSGGFSLRRVLDRFALNLSDRTDHYKPKYVSFLAGVVGMDNYINHGAVHFQVPKAISAEASGSAHPMALDTANTLDVAVIALA